MRARRQRRRRLAGLQQDPGAEPGTLVASPGAASPEITIIAYGPQDLLEQTVGEVSQVKGILGRYPVTWLNVDGLADVSVVTEIGEMFGLHRLALEDVLSNRQRAKVDAYEGYLFIVARMLMSGAELDTEQLSAFLGKDFLVTFQERPGGDPFGPARERIRHRHGLIRSAGPDYLAYALLDAVIDDYYPVLEEYGERLDDLEAQVTTKLNQAAVTALHAVKRDLLTLRRAVWPLRDAVNSLLRDDSSLVAPGTRIFLRDCYDHVVTIIDLIETYRELGSSLMDVYLSSVSNHMNEIMKVLTVIATIFMPATLIAGIYGMNFNPERSPLNMPELDWYYGYPYAILLMIAMTAVTLIIFRRKGWLGGRSDGAAAQTGPGAQGQSGTADGADRAVT